MKFTFNDLSDLSVSNSYEFKPMKIKHPQELGKYFFKLLLMNFGDVRKTCEYFDFDIFEVSEWLSLPENIIITNNIYKALYQSIFGKLVNKTLRTEDNNLMLGIYKNSNKFNPFQMVSDDYMVFHKGNTLGTTKIEFTDFTEYDESK